MKKVLPFPYQPLSCHAFGISFEALHLHKEFSEEKRLLNSTRLEKQMPKA